MTVFGWQIERKIEGHFKWEPTIFNKNMGSLGDSGGENGGLNSPTYMAPPKWECPLPGKQSHKHMCAMRSELTVINYEDFKQTGLFPCLSGRVGY